MTDKRIILHRPHDKTVIVRTIGVGLRLYVLPIATNEVAVTTYPIDPDGLHCGEPHPAYNDYGSCYLQRGHEGDHRAHSHSYWTWSTHDEQRST